jgi:hypothetical protein
MYDKPGEKVHMFIMFIPSRYGGSPRSIPNWDIDCQQSEFPMGISESKNRATLVPYFWTYFLVIFTEI